jgi:hypothetical protein
MKRRLLIFSLSFLLVGSAGGLTGCSSTPLAKSPSDPVVDRLLNDAWADASKLPSYSSGPEDKVPNAILDGPSVTVVWQGNADDLLRRVAYARKLKFGVYGPYPRQSLPVFVNMSAVPFVDFMNDVGHQLGQRADLVLTDTKIEIIYRGPGVQ